MEQFNVVLRKDGTAHSTRRHDSTIFQLLSPSPVSGNGLSQNGLSQTAQIALRKNEPLRRGCASRFAFFWAPSLCCCVDKQCLRQESFVALLNHTLLSERMKSCLKLASSSVISFLPRSSSCFQDGLQLFEDLRLRRGAGPRWHSRHSATL